ncbi:palmitoyl-acyl carrier protein thioesterase, chloroplastic-like isoform X2 [Lycium barbarum]|uniref:palmitoyl-acyl carrier protein thioesterase, chloroplastic-like isoform X2 n=1 Tax=Lycium barbarum TaxID=112863 RepID=UPI00293E757D|nr:palmitoyl-acyl carrier protein thioesterase, chloroplastic-like isoform X2 [Lycium barbarum]
MMLVTAATGAFFSVANHSPESRGVNSKKSSFGSLQVNSNSPRRTVLNQLPDWSTAITTASLAQRMMLDWKHKHNDTFGLGKLIQDGFVFRQSFIIRSYEVGPDRAASIQTMMNHLQETALSHAKCIVLMDAGFGSTPEMSKRNLIWVVAKMQVLVDRYPTWGDVVQIDTWVTASGKNGMRRDWLVCDSNTGDILMRASSLWVMMNKETRKLSKMPDKVRTEIEGVFVDSPPLLDGDSRKLPKLDETTADNTRTGLSPGWSDLDVNQHVNNVKYIGWILESVPIQILEGYELAGMTLEYRRECRRESVLQALTSVLQNADSDLANSSNVECQHLLRLESGEDVVKGMTEWRPRFANRINNNGQFPEVM